MGESGRLGVLERAAGLTLGLYLAGIGVDGVTRGRFVYRNYLRMTVHTPTALVIGLIVLFIFSIGWRFLRH